MSIASLIRERRQKANITQAELARRIGASRFTVCKWEAGVRAPDEEFWAPLIREIGISLADLSPALASATEAAQ